MLLDMHAVYGQREREVSEQEACSLLQIDASVLPLPSQFPDLEPHTDAQCTSLGSLEFSHPEVVQGLLCTQRPLQIRHLQAP